MTWLFVILAAIVGFVVGARFGSRYAWRRMLEIIGPIETAPTEWLDARAREMVPPKSPPKGKT